MPAAANGGHTFIPIIVARGSEVSWAQVGSLDIPPSMPRDSQPHHQTLAGAGSATITRMTIRYPTPLRPGDRVGVTSPSSGVDARMWPRLEAALATVRERGYEVVLGACMSGEGHVSAPAAERAAELTSMLLDPTIRAIVPPWGGETAIDLLPLLDWAAIEAAEPTWVIGYSDISTIITPLTLRTGSAPVHGNNLMDTPYVPPPGLLGWLDLGTAGVGAVLIQSSPGRYRAAGHDDYVATPWVDRMSLDAVGTWARLDDAAPVDVSGRLIGGCIETLSHVAGTAYGDIPRWVATHAPEGTIVYVEAAEDDAYATCRALHGMRLAGFFAGANAVLVGRTHAPDGPTLTQREAVLDALGCLGVPILADVECGHVAPFLGLVNGALARVEHGPQTARITQSLT